jgi:ribosomal protein S18 acetylase RimI-like enzyme
MENSIQIIDYQPVHQTSFESLNRTWIEQYFVLEPIDLDVLQFPDKHILGDGGAILMAMYNGQIAGTVALKYVSPGVFEFTKMAVHETYRGLKLGKMLAVAAIDRARQLGAGKIILYSNTVLHPAISLYRNLGFVEVPVDGPYKRSNIKMEMHLTSEYPFTIRKASAKDLVLIQEIGRQTFYDTFAAVNTKEDMDDYLEKNFNSDQVLAELTDQRNTFLLVEDAGKVIGYAKVRKSQVPIEIKDANAVEIERVYASKDYLGKKVGQTLISACESLATKKGFDMVWLGVWEHNHRAIAFYKKSGYELFGSHPFILGNDHQTDLLMKKRLQ